MNIIRHKLVKTKKRRLINRRFSLFTDYKIISKEGF
jgi:hypothetical protein